jgi:predicted Zn-dependent protease
MLAMVFWPQPYIEIELQTSGDPFVSLQVLLHEIGHSLGMSHSDLVVDVMAPHYQVSNYWVLR